MNARQRFLAAMHYQSRDRSPLLDFNFWPETLPIWQEQGLPDWVDRQNEDVFFGIDFSLDNVGATGVRDGLAPTFRKIILEDRGDVRLLQQRDGVRVERRKHMSSWHSVGYLLTDRASWNKHYKPRLDPANRVRYPADWNTRVKTWCDPNRNYPIVLPGGSLYGWLRNWMGLENISMVIFDNPVWFEEMVTTVADCIIGVLERILATGGRFDACSMWEDMCYNTGPLINPKHFKKYFVPHYRRISDLLRKHGVDIIYLDCDGKIDDLIPLWLDAGINCMYPVEVGTWKHDPIELRQRFGKDLLMMGGFDKHYLFGSPEEIEKEIYRLLPLVEEGGYIGFPDHRVPPDVPYKNYVFFIETLRRVWGQDTNLKPMGVKSKKPKERRMFFYW